MNRFLPTSAAFILFIVSMSAFADDMGMTMSGPKQAADTASSYRFELGGPVEPEGSGKSIVTVRLLHDGKPVVGAIVIHSRADMSPIGMAGMTAPIKPLGEQPPGTYRFEVDSGAVWKKPDKWLLSFHAKVQGVTQTVSGNVTVTLAP